MTLNGVMRADPRCLVWCKMSFDILNCLGVDQCERQTVRRKDRPSTVSTEYHLR